MNSVKNFSNIIAEVIYKEGCYHLNLITSIKKLHRLYLILLRRRVGGTKQLMNKDLTEQPQKILAREIKWISSYINN